MNWQVYWHGIFENIIYSLIYKINKLETKHSDEIKGHPAIVLFIAIMDALKKIREDPTAPQYLLGNTLGKEHRDWRRAKNGLPDRYRLFFKFFGKDRQIFFAWLNDENTLRKDGAKTDCYRVFRRMLDQGLISSDQAELLAQSIKKESE